MLDEKVTVKIPTGVSGLDEILYGGLIPGRSYLVRGGPGTGKTILGLHFLTAGVANGERALYVNLAEPIEKVRYNAASIGLDLTGVDFLDLSPAAEFFTQSQSYDIFSPAEVEREPTTQKIVEQVQSLQPQRIFMDAMTQFRYFTPDAYQFRRQMVSFLRFVVEQGSTVLFSSEASQMAPDDDLQYVADGIINLQSAAEGRTLEVTKFRGSGFRSGQHALRLTNQGMEVFPRLLPEKHTAKFAPETIASGVPELDEMLHGGIERGTVTIVTGPNGVGKTTVGLQFMKEAAGRGERSVIYIFEESVDTLIARSQGINIPVQAMIERGTLAVNQIEPLYYTPDEFAKIVRMEVEERGVRIVMVDSIAGYRVSLRGQDLITHLHALCKYLTNMGVTVILVNEVESILGEFRITEYGISYLSDNLIFMRYLEVKGEIRKVIGVLKKRLSDFERSLREVEITRYGLKVGRPVTGLRGILLGTPELVE